MGSAVSPRRVTIELIGALSASQSTSSAGSHGEISSPSARVSTVNNSEKSAGARYETGGHLRQPGGQNDRCSAEEQIRKQRSRETLGTFHSCQGTRRMGASAGVKLLA
jgi:hypothetical protein